MPELFRIRATVPSDAAGIARVHVQAWRETYRGQIADDVLDAPDFEGRRARDWARTLSRPRGEVAVAERGGETIVGFASAGPSRDNDLRDYVELYAIYTLSAVHGLGAGQALLDTVVPSGQAFLWVAAINPRAQAFYRRNGFRADGSTKNDGIDEVRMVRAEGDRPL